MSMLMMTMQSVKYELSNVLPITIVLALSHPNP